MSSLALPGTRQLTVSYDEGVNSYFLRLNDAVTVNNPNPLIVELIDDFAFQNQATSITVVGSNTNFQQGVTTVSFGPDVTVQSVTVQSPTRLVANITPTANAAFGPRTVTATTGAQVATYLYSFYIYGTL